MKISNSKKELAKIISENGGWREGAKWAAQDRDWLVSYFDGSEKPVRPSGKGGVVGKWVYSPCYNKGWKAPAILALSAYIPRRILPSVPSA